MRSPEEESEALCFDPHLTLPELLMVQWCVHVCSLMPGIPGDWGPVMRTALEELSAFPAAQITQLRYPDGLGNLDPPFTDPGLHVNQKVGKELTDYKKSINLHDWDGRAYWECRCCRELNIRRDWPFDFNFCPICGVAKGEKSL